MSQHSALQIFKEYVTRLGFVRRSTHMSRQTNMRDYYLTYAEAYAEESKQSFEESNVGEEKVQGFFVVMM